MQYFAIFLIFILFALSSTTDSGDLYLCDGYIHIKIDKTYYPVYGGPSGMCPTFGKLCFYKNENGTVSELEKSPITACGGVTKLRPEKTPATEECVDAVKCQ
jgi:hypothetical protein